MVVTLIFQIALHISNLLGFWTSGNFGLGQSSDIFWKSGPPSHKFLGVVSWTYIAVVPKSACFAKVLTYLHWFGSNFFAVHQICLVQMAWIICLVSPYQTEDIHAITPEYHIWDISVICLANWQCQIPSQCCTHEFQFRYTNCIQWC